MNAIVQEWIAKANGDYLTASREICASPPNYDAVCFHAQQCIEKLIKAILIAKGKKSPKTHDLTVLDSMLTSVEPQWHWPVEELRLLSQAAVAFRYPGESAGPEEAKAAFDVCGAMKPKLLAKLK
jgi:HEPN domain-containing protein